MVETSRLDDVSVDEVPHAKISASLLPKHISLACLDPSTLGIDPVVCRKVGYYGREASAPGFKWEMGRRVR